MLKEIEETSSMISLEAYCGTVSFENAFSKLPGFVEQLRSFLGSKLGDALSANFFGNRPQVFIRNIGKTTYTDFKHVMVFVPQGLNVPYLTHQKVLQDACDVCLKIEETTLDPLIKWLGERIGNPSALTSVSSTLKVPSGEFENIEKAYHDGFIVNGQKQSEVPYMKAIQKQSDWDTIITGVERMEKQLTADFHKRLLDKMARLDNLLSTLVRRIEENPDVFKFSPSALADLATTAYAAARQLEFYGLTKYRLESYSVSIRDTVKKLEVFVK